MGKIKEIAESRLIRPVPGAPTEQGHFDQDYFAGDGNPNYPTDGAYFDPHSHYRLRFQNLSRWVSRNLNTPEQPKHPDRPLTLLEVGGSVGHLPYWMERVDPDIHVVYGDYNFDVAKWGKERYGTSPVQFSGDALPFRTGSVDGVLYADVLEHLTPEQAEKGVLESMRVLGSEGRLFVSIPNRRTWTRKNWHDPTHLWIPTRRDMVNIFTEAGFEDIQHTTRGFPYNARTRAMRGGRDLEVPMGGMTTLIHGRKPQK